MHNLNWIIACHALLFCYFYYFFCKDFAGKFTDKTVGFIMRLVFSCDDICWLEDLK